ncbi:hypothetical protein AAG906_018938 [Vitis piasezkii]
MVSRRNSYGKRAHSQSDYGDNGENKRRNLEDNVYRYLCPEEILEQLKVDTKFKNRIGEIVVGCEEHVVIIYSSNVETNAFDDSDTFVSPTQNALFRVHDELFQEVHGEDSKKQAKFLFGFLCHPIDKIICSESNAQIRILKDDHLPSCSLKPSIVRKILYQIASRLHDNPS